MSALRRCAPQILGAFRMCTPVVQLSMQCRAECSRGIMSKAISEASSTNIAPQRASGARSQEDACGCMHCQRNLIARSPARLLHSSALSAVSTSQSLAASLAFTPFQSGGIGWLMAQRNLNREPEPFEGEYNEDEFEDGEFEDADLRTDEGWADLDLEDLDDGDDWEEGEDEDNSDEQQRQGKETTNAR